MGAIMKSYILFMHIVFACSFPAAAESWKFASTADFVHHDLGYPLKETSESRFTYYFDLVKEQKAEMLWFAGDYVMGHWRGDSANIFKAAKSFFAAWRSRIIANGFDNFYAAVGDHDIGDCSQLRFRLHPARTLLMSKKLSKLQGYTSAASNRRAGQYSARR